MNESTSVFGRFWVAVGDQLNWERGLENGIWGLRSGLYKHWKKISIGDMILLYVKAPIKGFVGAGIVRSVFKQDRPLWKEEIEEKNVIWPFRFEFDIIHLLPLKKWDYAAISNKKYNLAINAGINPVANNQKGVEIVEKLGLSSSFGKDRPHAYIDSILDIGKIQRMVVESNYELDGDKIDVIWKRTIRSVPTFSFSVNVDEDLKLSYDILKHSFDIWNSKPFLVTDKSRLKEISALNSGLYHEFSENLKVITFEQLQELYAAKKKYFNLESQYGLR